MRAKALLLAVACAVPALGGCTVIDDESTPESESRLKIAHAGGETIVPAHADRVVALEPDAAETARALGVRVVGRDPDPGAVFAVDPELIFGSKRRHGRLYPRLREIGPTVLEEGPGVDWKLNLRLHGESLNQPDAGERLLLDYDRRVAEVRRRLGPRRGRTRVSVIRVERGGVYAYAKDSFASTLVGDVGFARPAAQAERTERVLVPPGDLRSIDADVLILGVARGAAPVLRRLMEDPAWTRLRAVRTGRVRRVNDRTWFVGQGILSAREALRDLARLPAG